MAALGVVLVAGVVLCGLCFAFVDVAAVRALADAPRPLIAVAQLLTALGLSGYMLVITALVAGGAFWAGNRSPDPAVQRGLRALVARAFFVFATVAVSGILAQLVKHVVGRARPRLIDTLGPFHFDLFSIKASLASFPSGHTTSICALATALILMAPALRWPLVGLAVLVAISRFVVGAHYPSDVAAGAALGCAVSLALAIVFARRSTAFMMDGGLILLKDPGTVLPALRKFASRRSVSNHARSSL